MRTYLFWHRPRASVDARAYEQALMSFHRALAEQSPPGFRGSASYRIPAAPWLGKERGYEDWYLIDGSWALDPLNEMAAAGPMMPSHNAAAAEMETGYGGLYSLISGAADLPERRMQTWLTRPRGIPWKPALEALRRAHPGIACWRRQMVLGPAPEFLVTSPFDHTVDPPKGWLALPMESVRLDRTHNS